MKWSEFYFVLKPSGIGGVGVFAVVDIAAGAQASDPNFEFRVARKETIPTEFHRYCIHKNDEEFYCPPRFDCMQIGWYINHSTEANVTIFKDYRGREMSKDNLDPSRMALVTCRKIAAGEEILVDYNSFGEPEHLREDYYTSLIA